VQSKWQTSVVLFCNLRRGNSAFISLTRAVLSSPHRQPAVKENRAGILARRANLKIPGQLALLGRSALGVISVVATVA